MVDEIAQGTGPFVTMVTPPSSVHSHHNAGTKARELAHRAGRRPALSLPHDGVFVRGRDAPLKVMAQSVPAEKPVTVSRLSQRTRRCDAVPQAHAAFKGT
jgi:hypothetical protein